MNSLKKVFSCVVECVYVCDFSLGHGTGLYWVPCLLIRDGEHSNLGHGAGLYWVPCLLIRDGE